MSARLDCEITEPGVLQVFRGGTISSTYFKAEPRSNIATTDVILIMVNCVEFLFLIRIS